MSIWKNHINKFGLLVQDDGTYDAHGKPIGNDLDTPQRMGMFWLGQMIRVRLDLAVDTIWGLNNSYSAHRLLECQDSPGDYMRSPNPDSRGNYCDMMTRDQQTGIIAMLMAGGMRMALRKLFWNNVKRFWFTNNRTGWRVDRKKNPELVGKSWPDFAGFDQMSMCFRGMGWWWMWPLMIILDLPLLFSAVQYRWFNKDYEPLNFVVMCGASWLKYPTPTSWLANRINDPEDLAMRIGRYMRRGPHKAPPLDTLWTKTMLEGFMR